MARNQSFSHIRIQKRCGNSVPDGHVSLRTSVENCSRCPPSEALISETTLHLMSAVVVGPLFVSSPLIHILATSFLPCNVAHYSVRRRFAPSSTIKVLPCRSLVSPYLGKRSQLFNPPCLIEVSSLMRG